MQFFLPLPIVSTVNGPQSTVNPRPGYVFLVTVLVIGVIATVTATSLMLLGWAAEQNGLLVSQSAQAFEYAQTCSERALKNLRDDPAYAGSGTIQFDSGSCTIHAIGGQGNDERTICSEGASGGNIRRLEIRITRLYPSILVRSWREVGSFSICP